MKTLYIDVYFFINFTVDILALYFSAVFYKVPTTIFRLLFAAFIGALYAVFGVLLIDSTFLMYPISVLFLIVMVLIMTRGSGIYRKIKYGISFLIFQILIGGLVYYGYSTLDRFVEVNEFIQSNDENKKLLVLSLIILMSIGVLKLIILLFGNTRCERNVKIIVDYGGRENDILAFVDSGNLAVDPFDKTPVMFVGASLANKIFGSEIDLIDNPENISYGLKKRLRIIPINSGGVNKIVYGIKPDSVRVVTEKKQESISVIIAIDKEGGSYGGYTALIPLSALDDAFYGNK